MVRSFCLGCLFVLSFFCGNAQIFPGEGSILNSRIIGFRFPSVAGVEHYVVEIAKGNFNDEVSFNKNIIEKLKCDNNKVMAEVPDFGIAYTWRITTRNKGSGRDAEALHHFYTGAFPADGDKNRLRITHKAETYKDGYVFLDGFRALYDMDGKPVWFLPDNVENTFQGIRDLKITPQNSITFITDRNQAYEISYYGTILWEGPDNKNENINNGLKYHHELTRLLNGHYMVEGNEQLKWGELAKPESLKPSDSALNNKELIFGTVIEYDEHGKVIWKWKSSDYFRQDGLYYYNIAGNDDYFNPHMNSFYFDEKNKVIYVSFKRLNRIIKIKYPEGTIISEYGERFKNGIKVSGDILFCSQHSCKISQDGHLYLYNNNDCKYPDHPSVMVLEETGSQSEPLRKIWEYVCPVNITGASRPGKPPTNSYSSGGSVTELPDNTLLMNLSNPFGFSVLSGLSIINKEKKIVWGAEPEKWNADKQDWQVAPQYRVSIITSHSLLEELIWAVEYNK